MYSYWNYIRLIQVYKLCDTHTVLHVAFVIISTRKEKCAWLKKTLPEKDIQLNGYTELPCI